MAKTEKLLDNFASASSVKWGNYGANPTVTSGRLSITPTSGYPSIYSAVPYDFTGSYIFVQLYQAPNLGTGTISAAMNVQVSSGNNMAMVKEGSNLIFREQVAGVNSDTTVTFDSIAHAWWRLREQGGTLYWDTSPDSLNWTNRRSKTRAIPAVTSVTVNFLAGFYGTEPSPGVALFDNFNVLVAPVELSSFAVGRAGMGGADGGTVVARDYFPNAEWLWGKIPASPVLDPDSAAMVTSLSSTTGGAIRSAGPYEYGVTIITPDQITPSTPRYVLPMFYDPSWGTTPIPDAVPIPYGTTMAPGTDKHLTVADPVSGKVFSFWQVLPDGAGGWKASWGGVAPYNGDGLESSPGSSTATRLSRYAAVIRAHEIAAGQIPHALFFATDMAHTTSFRYPATKTDGDNAAGVSKPIPEGARVQLDPTIDVDAISGITPAEVAIAKALQTYGAYCGDKGGARMGFIFEFVNDGTSPGQVYIDAGIAYDYFNMTHIPWSSLRVLNKWDGSA